MRYRRIRHQRMGRTRPAHRLVRATNECGKVAYLSRDDCQIGKRSFATGENGLRPYQCGKCGLWHLGHIPEMVRLGVVSADEWYGHHGHRAHYAILPFALKTLRQTGIHDAQFSRTPTGEWVVSGAGMSTEPHADPIAAAMALITAEAATRHPKE